MGPRALGLLVAAVATASALLAFAETKATATPPAEQTIDVKSVPAPVLETVTNRFKDAEIVAATLEKTAAGKDVYEISMKRASKTIDSILTPEGDFVLIEVQIDRKGLPTPVATSLDKGYPQAKIERYEEIYTVADKVETLAYYEVLLVDKKKQLQSVEYGLDGKVLKIEMKKAGEVD
jgi:hypothetical protein